VFLGIRDKIVVLRMSGKSYSEIARELGVSESFVHAVLRVRGLSSSPFRKISDEDLRRAAEMYRAGVSMRQIARVLGVSDIVIRLYLRALLGLQPRVRSRCPEISREELARLYLLKTDGEIARIYGTTASCIQSLRMRYKLFATQSSELLSDIERMIAENCYIYFHPRPRWRQVLNVLAKKGYKVARIDHIDAKFRHIIPKEVKGYIVYRQGCEKAVATHIANLIARHVNQQTPRTQIIAAVIDLIWRNKFPEEDRGLIRDLIIDQLLEPTAAGS